MLYQKISRANDHKQLDQLEPTIISLTKITNLILRIRKRKRIWPLITTTREPTRRLWTLLAKKQKPRNSSVNSKTTRNPATFGLNSTKI